MTRKSISQILSEFVTDSEYKTIPEKTISLAKLCILDLIGVALAGSAQPIAKILRTYLDDIGGSPNASVIGLGVKTSCESAALANGTLGHSLDYDDFLVPVLGAGGPHITAAVLPAALAIGERYRASGKDVIAAYILGCEVTCRVGRGVDPYHYNVGWHTTSTEGVFGATAAAGKLLGLNVEELTHGFGLSASQSGGLRENFGTLAKPFHAGLSAKNGVKSATLAKLGFTSSRTIFEGRYGFCRVLSRNPRLDQITKNLGKPYCIHKIHLKPYPSCGATHSAIEATRSIIQGFGLEARNIRHIKVRCNPLVRGILPFDEPKSALEAKFSMPFCVATVVADGQVSLQHFTDEKTRSPRIVELMKRVKLTPDARVRNFGAIVEIATNDGRTYPRTLYSPRGSPEAPLSERELTEKYRSCARLALTENEIEQSLGDLMNFEKIDDISELAVLKLVASPYRSL